MVLQRLIDLWPEAPTRVVHERPLPERHVVCRYGGRGVQKQGLDTKHDAYPAQICGNRNAGWKSRSGCGGGHGVDSSRP